MAPLSKDAYYMKIADVVRERSTCTGSRVGAVLVKDDRIISTGYSGVPDLMPNCDSGGCVRCKGRREGSVQSGQDLDVCICVHAEANAVLTAARVGVSTRGTMMYVTHQPCFTCAKELLQAGITYVIYGEPYGIERADVKKDYDALAERLNLTQLVVDSRRQRPAA